METNELNKKEHVTSEEFKAKMDIKGIWKYSKGFFGL